jgi:hypothetical protein
VESEHSLTAPLPSPQAVGQEGGLEAEIKALTTIITSVANKNQRASDAETGTRHTDEEEPIPEAILVRGVNAHAFKALTARSGFGRSVNRLIASIINSVATNPKLFTAVMEADQDVAPLLATFEQLAWSDHGFQRERWHWAIRGYAKVLKMVVSGRESTGAHQLARHRAGWSLLELATDLEFDGLKQSRADWFDSAELAVCAAMALHDEFIKLEPTRRVLHYNQCCCWALRARLRIHKMLVTAGDAKVLSLKEIPGGRDISKDDRWFEELGGLWKGTGGGTDGVGKRWRRDCQETARIDKFGNNALEELNAVVTSEMAGTPEPDDDVGFWAKRSEKDEDLLFLQTDEKFESRLKKLTEDYHKREPVASTNAKLFEDVLGTLPPATLAHAMEFLVK